MYCGFAAPSITAKGWTPLSLGSALAAWYDINDASTVHQASNSVSQIDDKSGNGYHLLQNTQAKQPVYGSTSFQYNRPGLVFDAVNAVISAANTIIGTTAFSCFAFAQRHTGAGSQRALISYQGNGQASDATSPGSVLPIETDGTAGATGGIAAYRGGYLSNFIGTSQSGVFVQGDYLRFGSVFDGVNNTLYIDDAVAGVSAATSGSLATPGIIHLCSDYTDGAAWAGVVSEVIIMNRAATAGERHAIDNWFLRNYQRILVTEGDSIASLRGGYAYLALPSLTTKSTFLSNVAFGGSRLSTNGASGNFPGDLTIRAAGYTDARWPAEKGTRQYVLHVGIGANDIDRINQSGAAAYAAAIGSYCQARKAAGADKVTLATVLSRTDAPFGGVAMDTTRRQYNDIITGVGWAAANGVDTIIDFASDAIMGVDAAPSVNPTYFDDSVHPNASLGHPRLAPYFIAAMNALT